MSANNPVNSSSQPGAGIGANTEAGVSVKKATRAAYGETLVELVEQGLDVYAVDADLSGSTTTATLGKVYPERLINTGIAEQNMIGVACGLALTGKVAFTGSFAVFGTGRVYDQIRNSVCHGNLNVKIAPTHAGISVGADGGSHQMVEDIALMRVLPNMRVLVPADYLSTKHAIALAARTPGPVYIRMGRTNVEQIDLPTSDLNFGRARIVKSGTDITIVACGVEVGQALSAALMLEGQGIRAEVIDAFSVKPLDEECILKSLQKTGRIITVEEHSVLGGLGEAVTAVISEHPNLLKAPAHRIGVQDRFGSSGEFDELFSEYGLDAKSICDVVLKYCDFM